MMHAKDYLYDMKEYWRLKNEIKQEFLSQWHKGELTKEELKNNLKEIMVQGVHIDKLKLVLKNSINNYRIDNNIVKQEDRIKMNKKFSRFPFFLQEKVENAFDLVEDELSLIKKHHDEDTEYIRRHLSTFGIADVLQYFGGKNNEISSNLSKFSLIYFQVPSLSTFKSLFKEQDTSKFAHIGAHNSDLAYPDKEKAIETLVNLPKTEISNFDFCSLLKTGIPSASRYKFYKSLIAHWRSSIPNKTYDEVELTENEIDIFRFILYSDVDVNPFLAFKPLRKHATAPHTSPS